MSALDTDDRLRKAPMLRAKMQWNKIVISKMKTKRKMRKKVKSEE